MTKTQNKIIKFEWESRQWQREVLNNSRDKKRAVVVAHRRAGKTELICVKLILAAIRLGRTHPKPLFSYIAPFLKQAKQVAWDRLKFYARKFPNTKINESELIIELFNGTKIQLFGADYPDRLRGLGFDGVIMDEVAQMRRETWEAIVRPALLDHNGWAFFVGTPKGQNLFYELYQIALNTPKKWYAGMYTINETDLIKKEELENLKNEMGENLFRQEFLCDFTADNIDSFIEFDLVDEAVNKKYIGLNLAPLVFGLDPARFGDDSTVLIARQGLEVKNFTAWQGQDLMTTAGKVAQLINKEKPEAIFVDSVGLGAGVVDRLRQLGFKIIAVNSGSKATNALKYVNKKAEMWAKTKEWLKEGAVLPNLERLKVDLLAPTYDYDPQNRLKIESKDSLKGRGLLSTDYADALALTFAYNVNSENRKNRPAFAEM